MEIGSVLLSAGVGKRLRPLTEVVAKPAVPILDVPLGAFGLADLLVTAPPVVVNVSHLGDTVLEAFHTHMPGGEWIAMHEEPVGYGTAGTLAALKQHVRERIVVRNADTYSDLSTADVIATHILSGAPLTLASQEVAAGADIVVEEGRAVQFIDRRYDPSSSGARYIGVAVLEKNVLKKIPERRPLGLGESVFRPLVESGDVAVHVHDGYALDVGSVDHYLKANADALAGRGPRFAEGWPGTIEHDTYVGPDAIAAPDTLGAGAVVLRGARIEPGAFVERAVVWPNEIVPSGKRATDCLWFGGQCLRPWSAGTRFSL